jgi:hypothetical protein
MLKNQGKKDEEIDNEEDDEEQENLIKYNKIAIFYL